MGKCLLGLLVCVASCAFDDTVAGLPAAPDGGGNEGEAARCEDWSYAPLYVDPCDPARPVARDSLSLDVAGTYVYDTDRATLTAPDGATSVLPTSVVAGGRAIWLRGLSIGRLSALRGQGTMPLLIVSEADIDVAGAIAVNSHRTLAGYAIGAGANGDPCPIAQPEAGQRCAQHGGSGGGGGAFAANGGDGGHGAGDRDCGDGIHIDGIPGGRGGVATAVQDLAVRGGCGGRAGGFGDGQPTDAGVAGPGGGAVHLIARRIISVSGWLNAGGAGGGAGNGDRAGGGGGGSGGFLGLEAAEIQIAAMATLAANGGGGGGGSNGKAAAPGDDGGLGNLPARGGAKEGEGSSGGDGGAGLPDGASAGPADRGGGGGGGSAGRILLVSVRSAEIDVGAVLSPAADTRAP